MKRLLPRQTHSLAGVTLLAALLAIGCGGPPKSAPPLDRTVKDTFLAPVPVETRMSHADTARSIYLAEAAIGYAEVELKSAKVEIGLAENDKKKAKLSQNSAEVRSDRAKELAMENGAGKSRADLEMDVAVAKLAHAKGRVAYLEAELMARKTALRAYEAKLELQKAESLAAAKIKAPDTKLSDYKSQYSDRASKAKASRAHANAKLAELKKGAGVLAKLKAQLAGKPEPVDTTGAPSEFEVLDGAEDDGLGAAPPPPPPTKTAPLPPPAPLPPKTAPPTTPPATGSGSATGSTSSDDYSDEDSAAEEEEETDDGADSDEDSP